LVKLTSTINELRLALKGFIMKYTGTKVLVAGTDGIIHTTIDEAIEARNTGDKPLCHSNTDTE
jgi:hypothetical protein